MQRAVELNHQSGEAQDGLRRAQRQLKLAQRLDYYKVRHIRPLHNAQHTRHAQYIHTYTYTT